jgi:hypothetical protein
MTDDLWLDGQRALAGDEGAAQRAERALGQLAKRVASAFDRAFTIDGPCPSCGSTEEPDRAVETVSSLAGETFRTIVTGYECGSGCGFTTTDWPRVPAPTTEEAQ